MDKMTQTLETLLKEFSSEQIKSILQQAGVSVKKKLIEELKPKPIRVTTKAIQYCEIVRHVRCLTCGRTKTVAFKIYKGDILHYYDEERNSITVHFQNGKEIEVFTSVLYCDKCRDWLHSLPRTQLEELAWKLIKGDVTKGVAALAPAIKDVTYTKGSSGCIPLCSKIEHSVEQSSE